MIRALTSAARLPLRHPSSTDDRSMRAPDRREERRLVQRPQRAQVDDVGLDALAGERLGGLEGLPQRAAVGFAGHASAGPAHRGPRDVDRAGVVRQLALHGVQRAVLEDEHRVGVLQRGPEHPPRVAQRCRGEHLDAGDVGVPALEAVRVLRRELAACSGGHADDERDIELAAGHVQQRRRVVEDLVEGQQREVDRHDLDDRSHPAHRRADARADERRLRERGVADRSGPNSSSSPRLTPKEPP
jgi:hypothetical protein